MSYKKPSIVAKHLGADQPSPSKRSSGAAGASYAATERPNLVKAIDKLAGTVTGAHKKAGAAAEKRAKAYIPNDKDLQRITGGEYMHNVSLDMPRIRTTHIDTNSVQAGFGPSGDKVPTSPRVKGANDAPEVRPDVGELTGGGTQARTSYRVPPKKPTPDRRGVPRIGMGARRNYRYTAASMEKSPEHRTLADLVIPGFRSGSPGVGSKPSLPANVSAAGTKRANKPPTQSSSAGLAAKGAVGRAGSEKRDIKGRNIEKPEKKVTDSISREVFNFLTEYKIIRPPSHGISRWTPKQGEFTPLRNLEPQEMPQPDHDANDPRMPTVNALAKTFGIDMVRGKRVTPSSRPTNKQSAEKQLFGEAYMNPNKIANKIIREAFTSGDRNNTTPNNNDMYVKGGLQRQMLAGEMVGSVIWPFDQTTNPMFDKLADFELDQAHNGLFGKQGKGTAMESVAKEIVDNLLEDSPSTIYSDTESIGYLLNEMCESGYSAEADILKSICEKAKEEDVVKVVAVIEKLETDKADPFLIEQLTKFANLLIEDDSKAADDADPSDPNTSKEDAAEKTDNNSTGVEP